MDVHLSTRLTFLAQKVKSFSCNLLALFGTQTKAADFLVHNIQDDCVYRFFHLFLSLWNYESVTGELVPPRPQVKFLCWRSAGVPLSKWFIDKNGDLREGKTDPQTTSHHCTGSASASETVQMIHRQEFHHQLLSIGNVFRYGNGAMEQVIMKSMSCPGYFNVQVTDTCVHAWDRFTWVPRAGMWELVPTLQEQSTKWVWQPRNQTSDDQNCHRWDNKWESTFFKSLNINI